jgi:hypothetical protein
MLDDDNGPWQRTGIQLVLISIHPYILERGKKKRLTGSVIRPLAAASRCVKVMITEAIKLWRNDFQNDRRRSRRN